MSVDIWNVLHAIDAFTYFVTTRKVQTRPHDLEILRALDPLRRRKSTGLRGQVKSGDGGAKSNCVSKNSRVAMRRFALRRGI
jgi:hypothetical protein